MIPFKSLFIYWKVRTKYSIYALITLSLFSYIYICVCIFKAIQKMYTFRLIRSFFIHVTVLRSDIRHTFYNVVQQWAYDLYNKIYWHFEQKIFEILEKESARSPRFPSWETRLYLWLYIFFFSSFIYVIWICIFFQKHFTAY